MPAKPTTQTVTRPARISISYAALVALITEAVLFVQDVFIHHVWIERDTLFVIALVVGLITLVGPFLPVPVSFDSTPPNPADQPTPPVAAAAHVDSSDRAPQPRVAGRFAKSASAAPVTVDVKPAAPTTPVQAWPNVTREGNGPDANERGA